MPAGRAFDGTRRYAAAAAYALGVWSSLTLWAAVSPHLGLPDRVASGKDIALSWALLANMVPALMCGLGFRIGIAGDEKPSASTSGMRSLLVVFAWGVLFIAVTAALQPLFALFQGGLIPALVWTLPGSILAARLLRRLAKA